MYINLKGKEQSAPRRRARNAMNELKYPHLFQPIRLGNVTFRNRIFASPTSIHELTEVRHHPTEVINAYFERKAMGGAASVAVGDATVDTVHGLAGLMHIPLDDPTGAGAMYGLANAISRHGAVATMQLQHAGMFSSGSATLGNTVYGPVAGKVTRNAAVCVGETADVIAMDEDMIEHTIECFANAAAYAKFCGFGMVIIHGGHGWLLSQFLSSKVNDRTDRWGGSFENRMRFPLAVCDRIKQKCGKNFPVEFRMSATEACEKGYDFEEGLQIARALDGHVDLIHVSAGDHEDHDGFVASEPDMFHPHGCNVQYSAEIKKYAKESKVAVVGALNDPAIMDEIIATGKADVVEMARALIADPDLPIKARTGREKDIRKCLKCIHCFSHLVVQGRICCALNPEIGHELEAKIPPLPHENKHILIAGGGIGGMEAALEAAKLGHTVTLCEKKGELGGALRCERKVPFKENLDHYLDQQARLCEENPAIDIHLNTEVTPDVARSFSPDVIIAATGARPVKPPIPGIDGKNVVGAEEVYVNPDLAGEKVAILGGGLVGLELGIYLAGLGRKVTIVEMMNQMGVAGNVLHAIALDVQIRQKGIDLRLSTKALEISEQGVKVESLETKETALIEADTVIYAVGQRPETASAEALYDCAPDFYMLGDCTTPKNIHQATNSAYNIVRNIGVR